MNKEYKLIEIDGQELYVCEELYNKIQKCDEKDKEIDRLNNIINEFDKWLLGENMMFYKSNDGERLIRYGEIKNKWLKLKGGK